MSSRRVRAAGPRHRALPWTFPGSGGDLVQDRRRCRREPGLADPEPDLDRGLADRGRQQPRVRDPGHALDHFSFQESWNEFTHFLVATSDPDLATLNLGIARLSAGDLRGPTQFPLKLALATLSTIPIAIDYVFFSRYFIRFGATTGLK